MAKKEQFTKEEHQRADRQSDEIVHKIKSSKELMRTFESMISPSELRYYQLLAQYIRDKNDTVLNDEKELKELIDKYAQEIPEVSKSKIKAQNIEKIDSTDALWSIADDMRQKKVEGEFGTFIDAYRWAESYMTHKGKQINAKKLQRAYHKAKSEGKVD